MTRKSVLGGFALVVPMTMFAMGAGDDPPPIKEGLWSLHTVSTSSPSGEKTDSTLLVCHSHAYDDYVKGLTKQAEKTCSMNTALHGNSMTEDSSCKVQGTTISVKGTVTFSDTAIHSEEHSTYTPPMAGMSSEVTIRDHKYLGACPADMQPGDRKTADGKIMHGWKH